MLLTFGQSKRLRREAAAKVGHSDPRNCQLRVVGVEARPDMAKDLNGNVEILQFGTMAGGDREVFGE